MSSPEGEFLLVGDGMAEKNGKLDEQSVRLLKMLIDDSSTAQKNIASILKMSASKVSERISRMSENGIIKRFTVEVDYARLGYTTIGFFQLKLMKKDPESVEPILTALIAHQNIVEVYEIFGQEHDFLIKIQCRTNDELRDIGEYLNGIDNVDASDSATFPVARTKKRIHGVPL